IREPPAGHRGITEGVVCDEGRRDPPATLGGESRGCGLIPDRGNHGGAGQTWRRKAVNGRCELTSPSEQFPSRSTTSFASFRRGRDQPWARRRRPARIAYISENSETLHLLSFRFESPLPRVLPFT